MEILLCLSVLNEAALKTFFLSLTAGEEISSKQHSWKNFKKYIYRKVIVLIEFFLCPVPCLERLASILFVWRKLKVTQNWLCCCHSQIGFAVAILLRNGILVTFLLWSLKTSFCRSCVFHCDASAPVTRIMLRSVSKLRGIFGVAEQQGTLRGTSFTEHESQRLVCMCVCVMAEGFCLCCVNVTYLK